MAKKQKISTSGNTLTKERSESHSSKLNRIKSAIKKGTYAVDSTEVAKSLIKHAKEGKKKPE